MGAGTRSRRPVYGSKGAVSAPIAAPAMRLLVLLSARATSPCRASVPGSRRGRAMEAAGEGMSRPARRATYPRWEVLLDLDEDALAGALDRKSTRLNSSH